jgi:hypothetical protein
VLLVLTLIETMVLMFRTYVGFLAIIDQFLFEVLLLLHRPRLRLTQKQGNIRLTENGVQLNIKKTNSTANLLDIPTTRVYLNVALYM